MRAGSPLRFYASPVKLLLLLFGCMVFDGTGYWLLLHHGSRWSAFDVVMDYGAMVFFGICFIVMALVLIYLAVLRHPLLEIDGVGWRGRFHFLAKTQAVHWQDIQDIAVLRRSLAYGNQAYYLVVRVKDAERLPNDRVRSFNARFYRSLASAGMMLQLNLLFVRTTPAKIEKMLARIAVTCAYELQFYGVTLCRDIYPW